MDFSTHHARGLSAAEIATETGYSRAAVYKWAKGEHATFSKRAGVRGDPWLLRIERAAAGLSQSELADKAGYGRHTEIAPLETYRQPIGPARAQRLAAALGCRYAAIMSDAEKWEENHATYLRWVAAGRPSVLGFEVDKS